MEFHERLSKIRKANKMTQVEVAQKCELAIRTYQNYESGMRTPRTDVVDRLCKVFEVKNDILFNDSKCIEYLNSIPNSDSTNKEKKASKNRVDFLTNVFTESIGVSSNAAKALSVSSLSSALGVLAFPFITTGIGMIAYDSALKKEKNKDNLEMMLQEHSRIEAELVNINLSFATLKEKYDQLVTITQSDEATIEDYKICLQTTQLINLFQKFKELLTNKSRLCQKAIKLLSKKTDSIELYNDCFKEIKKLGKDEDLVVGEIKEFCELYEDFSEMSKKID